MPPFRVTGNIGAVGQITLTDKSDSQTVLREPVSDLEIVWFDSIKSSGPAEPRVSQTVEEDQTGGVLPGGLQYDGRHSHVHRLQVQDTSLLTTPEQLNTITSVPFVPLLR